MLILKRFFLSLFLSSLSGILIFILTYCIAVTISPPVLFDELMGEERRVMPIGQAILAALIATASGVALLIFFYRSYFKIISWFSRKQA